MLIPFPAAPTLKYFLVICLLWHKSETSPKNVPSFPFWHYIMAPEGGEWSMGHKNRKEKEDPAKME